MAAAVGCTFESLETRQLLSGIHLSRGVLLVTGSSTQRNTITVGLTPGDLSVSASITFPTHKGSKTIAAVYPLTDHIRYVEIRGGARSDLITIDQTNGSFPFPARIIAGSGKDTIYGGDEADYITDGGGADDINSGNGNDTIKVGYGKDTLIGGAGNDKLYGGSGHDLLEGVSGNNTLYAMAGYDTLYGGAGDNLFVVINSLKRDPINDYDASHDKLRKVPSSSSSDSTLDDFLNALEWPF